MATTHVKSFITCIGITCAWRGQFIFRTTGHYRQWVNTIEFIDLITKSKDEEFRYYSVLFICILIISTDMYSKFQYCTVWIVCFDILHKIVHSINIKTYSIFQYRPQGCPTKRNVWYFDAIVFILMLMYLCMMDIS